MSSLIYTGEINKPEEESVAKQSLSYIEPHEEQEAKRIVAQHLNDLEVDEPPRPAGYHLVVKVYVRGENISTFVDPITKEKKSIVLPESVTAHDKYTSCTALVIAVGPDAYHGERFGRSGPWCRVGDWVIIPRNEGVQINYRGIPMQIIPDDRILGVVKDPSWVTRS